MKLTTQNLSKNGQSRAKFMSTLWCLRQGKLYLGKELLLGAGILWLYSLGDWAFSRTGTVGCRDGLEAAGLMGGGLEVTSPL